MTKDREFELCEPSPFLYHENGQLAITDGAAVWMVVVTCEAMMVTAQPPEKSLRRLVRYAHLYCDLAAAAILRGEASESKVWVREADVISCKAPVKGQDHRRAEARG